MHCSYGSATAGAIDVATKVLKVKTLYIVGVLQSV
jgi:hypothetical protein